MYHHSKFIIESGMQIDTQIKSRCLNIPCDVYTTYCSCFS